MIAYKTELISRAAKAYFARYTKKEIVNVTSKEGSLSFRAFLLLTRYNGLRGSICVTDMVELIQGIPSGSVFHEGDKVTRFNQLRSL